MLWLTKEIKMALKKIAKPILFGSILFYSGFLLNCENANAAPKVAEIVVDANTGEVLYEENATAKRYPASITKVMTLYILFEAIENGQVKLDDQIYFSKNASYQKPTKLGIKAGNSISVETAIQALVIKSANDVAVAIAEHIAGSERDFAKLMTDKAHQIGMINSNFANASGLPNPNQISTAEDLSKLAIAIRRDFPMHYHWFGRENFVFNGVQMNNHNHLVGKIDGVDGLKTGYTSASGYNLATTSVRDGKMIVTVVLGGKTWRSRDARVTELIETAYAQSGIQSTGLKFNNPYQYSYNNFRDATDLQALLVDASFGNQNNQYSGSLFAQEKPIVKFNKQFVVAVKDASIDESINNEDEAEELNDKSNIKSPPKAIETPIEKPAIITTSFSVPEFTLKGAIDNELPHKAELPKEVEIAELPKFDIPSNIPPLNEENKQEEQSVKLAQIDNSNIVDIAKDEIPADLAKIIADEEKASIEEEKAKVAEKLRLAKIQEQKREEAKLAAKKAADYARQLAEVKAKADRSIAAKMEKERQASLLNQRGNVIVQVGAFKAKNEAQATILKLANNFPKFAKSEVSSTTNATGTWFRARFSGMAAQSAKNACAIITKTGAVCQIISK